MGRILQEDDGSFRKSYEKCSSTRVLIREEKLLEAFA